MARVSLRQVHKSYGDTAVIHGVNMEIADGELIVIVGPSGCGKSTLLRMVAGLEQITAGEIAIGERVVNRLEPKDRDIAMVFQNYALYPHMSVYENMSYGLRIRGMRKDDIDRRVQKAAATLQLSPLLGRKPRQLSGGQRQRVAMGRAIVREPAVFLFDEPLSNLDAKLRVQMRLEIKKLQRQLGTTSIYVTHDQVEAMTLADRLIVMNAGIADQIGTPMEIYDRPASVFVAGFIGSPSMNFIPGEMNASGTAVVLGAQGQALPVDPPLPAAGGRKVTVGLRPENLIPAASGDQHVDLRVDMVEPLGADTLLHGQFVAAASDITLRLPGHVVLEHGTTLALTAEPNRVHIFDRDSGKRIG